MTALKTPNGLTQVSFGSAALERGPLDRGLILPRDPSPNLMPKFNSSVQLKSFLQMDLRTVYLLEH